MERAQGTLPGAVRIVEVAPRDGLQNEPEVLDVATRAAFIRALAGAGLATIEASSFVRADRIPQMADAAGLFAQLRHLPLGPEVRIVALVPNLKGLERAMDAGVTSIAVFTAASETFNRRNINRSIAESLADIRAVADRARVENIWLRGYVSTAFGCPYEGRIDPRVVRDVTQALLDTGCAEISIGDTLGVATPKDVVRVMSTLLDVAPAERLALHLHDTRGTALVNVYAGLQLGIATFDSSAGGLGGCPYAPGASGNLATEDLVYLLDGLGITSNVDLDRLKAASAIVGSALRRKLPSRVLAAPQWPKPIPAPEPS